MSRRSLVPAAAVVLGGVLGLALTACAVSTGAAPVDVTPAPLVEVTQRAEEAVEETRGTVLSLEAAGDLYLALVEPTNVMLDGFDTAVATSDMAALREVSGDLAQGYGELATALEEAAWPVEAEAGVAALVLELEGEIPAWEAIAEAEGDDETATRLAELPPTGPAAAEIRSVLGLDVVPAG
ncbi:hypothetical protein ICW40_14955 [Actinotalea ferrariae]|uniref:hypothetical protein n=1 Tax=Actinotalea ferrariae TaxID=1386098 RepID=UPI001C8CB2CD|nr:hypothetical protein [Actinotalea ferrariae]MBX9246099.1 hypothetical protein [Actinotalea ferrariae]